MFRERQFGHVKGAITDHPVEYLAWGLNLEVVEVDAFDWNTVVLQCLHAVVWAASETELEIRHRSSS